MSLDSISLEVFFAKEPQLGYFIINKFERVGSYSPILSNNDEIAYF
jgi:hypothetical protein